MDSISNSKCNCWFLLVFILSTFSCQGPKSAKDVASVVFNSDNQLLNDGFIWAKRQALQFVFENDTVGKWYESSLPGRDAFCMRDVSHQSTGAQILGLADHNQNMLKKFAANISASKDWCSYWEINKENLPAPEDYKNDSSFWYNLPANFDMLDACYRMYQWTGDSTYLTDTIFLNFYNKIVTDFVTVWDKDQDGILENPRQNWPRGIPTYWESDHTDIVTGSDLLASMYAAFFAYSRMLDYAGDTTYSAEMKVKADTIQAIFNRNWWNQSGNKFYTGKNSDGSFDFSDIAILKFYPLYHTIINDKRKIELTLNSLNGSYHVEESSYLAEIFFRYNQNEKGLKQLLKQIDPNLNRRDYPENSFSVIGAFAVGLMGIEPHASQNLIATISHLSPPTSWAEMKNIPVFNNLIGVHHSGSKESRMTNQTGDEFLWQAAFPIISNVLTVNGESTRCERTVRNGLTISYVIVRLKAGETTTVQVPF